MFLNSWVERSCSKVMFIDLGNTSPCKVSALVTRESSNNLGLDLGIILQWRQAFVGVNRSPMQERLRLENSFDEG